MLIHSSLITIRTFSHWGPTILLMVCDMYCLTMNITNKLYVGDYSSIYDKVLGVVTIEDCTIQNIWLESDYNTILITVG